MRFFRTSNFLNKSNGQQITLLAIKKCSFKNCLSSIIREVYGLAGSVYLWLFFFFFLVSAQRAMNFVYGTRLFSSLLLKRKIYFKFLPGFKKNIHRKYIACMVYINVDDICVVYCSLCWTLHKCYPQIRRIDERSFLGQGSLENTLEPVPSSLEFLPQNYPVLSEESRQLLAQKTKNVLSPMSIGDGYHCHQMNQFTISRFVTCGSCRSTTFLFLLSHKCGMSSSFYFVFLTII